MLLMILGACIRTPPMVSSPTKSLMYLPILLLAAPMEAAHKSCLKPVFIKFFPVLQYPFWKGTSGLPAIFKEMEQQEFSYLLPLNSSCHCSFPVIWVAAPQHLSSSTKAGLRKYTNTLHFICKHLHYVICFPSQTADEHTGLHRPLPTSLWGPTGILPAQVRASSALFLSCFPSQN